MLKLTRQLQRLFLQPEGHSTGEASRLICLTLPAISWDAVTELVDFLTQDLDLPPPPVSVDGDGFRLWLSFAECLDPTEIRAFFGQLRQHALPDRPDDVLRLENEPITLPPSQLSDGERWTAFIDAGMGSLFTDEPSLDFAPNPDQQADLLAGYRSIDTRAFARAKRRLDESTANETPAAVLTAETAKTIAAFSDPSRFLTAVMNDQTVALSLRIEAAKALLPFSSADGEKSEH